MKLLNTLFELVVWAAAFAFVMWERLLRRTLYKEVNYGVTDCPNLEIFNEGISDEELRALSEMSTPTGFVKVGFITEPGAMFYMLADHILRNEKQFIVIVEVFDWWRLNDRNIFSTVMFDLRRTTKPIIAAPVLPTDPILPKIVSMMASRDSSSVTIHM